MVTAPAKPRAFDDPLLRTIMLTAIGLAVLHAAVALYWGAGPVIVELPWFALMINSFAALAALAVAFLAFGRYWVFRELAPLASLRWRMGKGRRRP